MLLWSVTATAGMPFSATALTNGLILTRPSTREYSVWMRRWTKEGLIDYLSSGRKNGPGDCNDGVSQGPVVMVPTVAPASRAERPQSRLSSSARVPRHILPSHRSADGWAWHPVYAAPQGVPGSDSLCACRCRSRDRSAPAPASPGHG